MSLKPGESARAVVCAIGTTEPWSAAGLALDLRAFAELGVHATIVVAAVSAQDGGGVTALHAVPLDLVRAQLQALAAAPIAAYRIGALPSLACARVVAEHVARADVPVVYDPALSASAGGALATGGEDLARLLCAHATVVTPNAAEAARILERPVTTVDEMRAAARALVALGARAALVTGGDLPGPVRDAFYDAAGPLDFEAPRLPDGLRGTGCLLADALTAQLARGSSVRAALEPALAFVRRKIAAGFGLAGMRVAE
jgi:hydroxymethylpyrimidine/phosphomethylpyrimidine kinase